MPYKKNPKPECGLLDYSCKVRKIDGVWLVIKNIIFEELVNDSFGYGFTKSYPSWNQAMLAANAFANSFGPATRLF